jgi:hypothetical protein
VLPGAVLDRDLVREHVGSDRVARDGWRQTKEPALCHGGLEGAGDVWGHPVGVQAGEIDRDCRRTSCRHRTAIAVRRCLSISALTRQETRIAEHEGCSGLDPLCRRGSSDRRIRKRSVGL